MILPHPTPKKTRYRYNTVSKSFNSVKNPPIPPSKPNIRPDDWVKNAVKIPPLGSNTTTNSVFKPTTRKTTNSKRLERQANYKLLNSASELLPNERVSTCLCCRVDNNKGVEVKHNGQTGKDGKAFYSNLMRCDSIWTCPMCSKRILAKRAQEVEKGINEWVENQGNSIFMLTLTIPHKQNGNLKTQLDKQRKANKRLFNDRVMQKVWAIVGKVGQIKTLEYTHGKNGHHNHSHAIVFSKLSPDEFKNIRLPVGKTAKGNYTIFTDKKIASLKKRGLESRIMYMELEQFIKFYWFKLVRDVGLGLGSLKHGASITGANNAKKYLTKFKTAQELTSNKKQAKQGNRNQWQLLADYTNGDKEAGQLFKYYAKCYKNERQLFWSRNLKDLLKIAKVDDSKIVEDDEPLSSETLAVIDFDVWSLIKRYKLRADVLTAVERDFVNSTQEYITLINDLRLKHAQYLAEQRRLEEEYYRNYIPDKFMKPS